MHKTNLLIRILTAALATHLLIPALMGYGEERILEIVDASTALDGNVYYVSATKGNDANDGTRPDTAFSTLQFATSQLKAGDTLIVQTGTYYESVTISNIDGTEDHPIWIVAESPGEAVVSAGWEAAGTGEAEWKALGGGYFKSTYTSSESNDNREISFGGWNGYFLFEYKSVGDLLSPSVKIRKWGGLSKIDKPDYGFAIEKNTIYLRLPGGIDPNGESVIIASGNNKTNPVSLQNSSYLIFDGIRFEGTGDWAIRMDRFSPHNTIRNCLVHYCRRGFGCDSETLVEWCEYRFPGYSLFAKQLQNISPRNDSAQNIIFGFVKRYHYAHTEGHLIGRPWSYRYAADGSYHEGGVIPKLQSPENNVARYNLCHETFDGFSMGGWSESNAYRNVFLYQYDNALEMEAGASFSRNNRFYENLILGTAYGEFSHQDTVQEPGIGPNYIYRNISVQHGGIGTDPWTIIKFLAPNVNEGIYYYNNLIYHNSAGSLIWDKPEVVKGIEKISMRNNIIMLPDGFGGRHADLPIHASHNFVVAPNECSWLTGSGGKKFASIEDLQLEDIAGNNFNPKPDSPVIDAGIPVPGIVDGLNGKVNVGPIQAGEYFNPDTWPRPRKTAFNLSPPESIIPEEETEPTIILAKNSYLSLINGLNLNEHAETHFALANSELALGPAARALPMAMLRAAGPSPQIDHVSRNLMNGTFAEETDLHVMIENKNSIYLMGPSRGNNWTGSCWSQNSMAQYFIAPISGDPGKVLGLTNLSGDASLHVYPRKSTKLNRGSNYRVEIIYYNPGDSIKIKLEELSEDSIVKKLSGLSEIRPLTYKLDATTASWNVASFKIETSENVDSKLKIDIFNTKIGEENTCFFKGLILTQEKDISSLTK